MFLGYNFKEKLLSYLNQQSLICVIGVFDQYIGFDIGSDFSEGPLYEVCNLMVNTRGVFRIQSNIYDGAFFENS